MQLELLFFLKGCFFIKKIEHFEIEEIFFICNVLMFAEGIAQGHWNRRYYCGPVEFSRDDWMHIILETRDYQ